MADKPAEAKKPPKYLIQSETGDVYHYTAHLAARGDMFPYDEKTFGPVVDGKSKVLSEKSAAKKDE